MGHIPVGMEMFNAADEEQWAVITRTIDQCDYYIVIIAHRYGSTTPEDISFTEKEYDYAVFQGIPVLGFIIDENVSWPANWIDKEHAAAEALKRFKSKVKQKIIRVWSDRSVLQAQVAVSLAQSINLNPRRGWIRTPLAADADVAQSISALAQSVAGLRGSKGHNPTTEMEYGAKVVLDMLSNRTWKIGNRNTDGGEIFLTLCELLGSNSSSVDRLTKLMNVNSMDLLRFLNRLELLGALKQDSLGDYTLAAVGTQMYKRLIRERELDV